MKTHKKKLIMPMFLMLALTCLLAAGCAKKPTDTNLEDGTADGTMTEDMTQDSQTGIGESGLDESAIGDDGMGGATTDIQGLERINFDFDQYNLGATAQQILVNNAQYLKANPTVKVRIEGYCDERGSDEYNLALGQRRALAAKNYLVSLGVSADRLSVISYGEELPLDPSGTEEAYAMNRRAEFKSGM
jgi:peptidoglycan-associated lipoprotein